MYLVKIKRDLVKSIHFWYFGNVIHRKKTSVHPKETTINGKTDVVNE